MPTTVGRQRAADPLEEGKVDTDVETEFEEQIRTVIVNELRPLKTPVPVADAEQSLEGYPEGRLRVTLRRLEALGFVSKQDGTVMLERDPWTAEESDPAQQWLGREWDGNGEPG